MTDINVERGARLIGESKYGIKVVKSGKDTSSHDLRDFIVHSDYSMFKFHDNLNGELSIDVGETEDSLTLYHNLGHVPAFWFYEDGILMPRNIKAKVDDEKIVLTKTLDEPYGETTTEYFANQAVFNYYTGFNPDLAVFTGKLFGSTNNSAFWFEHIYANQGAVISSANFRLERIGTLLSGSQDVLGKYWGVDEDNTPDLGGGYPGGRPKTSAYYTKAARVSGPGGWSQDIKDIVQEIVNRGGWSNGNHMCFMLEDNGSYDGAALYSFDSPPSASNMILDLTVQTATEPLTTDIDVIVCKDKIG